MAEPTLAELERIWVRANSIKKVSDRIVGLGPFGFGLRGLISLLNNPLAGPFAAIGIGADELYTWAAGLYLVWLALQARCSAGTITRILLYIIIDSVMGLIPFAGGPLDFIFQGHLYAARALQKDIERRHPA